jgi:hypothetical protein
MRLFFFVDGDQVAAFEAGAAPRTGEAVWIKTLDFEGNLIVETVEHEFDRSSAERYASHDVSFNCRVAKAMSRKSEDKTGAPVR